MIILINNYHNINIVRQLTAQFTDHNSQQAVPSSYSHTASSHPAFRPDSWKAGCVLDADALWTVDCGMTVQLSETLANSKLKPEIANMFAKKQTVGNPELKGRKNYKTWKRILDMNLESLEFHKYIYTDDEPLKEIEEKIRKTRARARMYIYSSLSSNLQSAVSRTKTVFEMLSLLIEKYGENETLDCADLIDHQDNIKFKIGYKDTSMISTR